jgi:hypothetical protein
VVRVPLGRSEWMLAVPPAGTVKRLLRPLARDLAARIRARGNVAGMPLFARVPDSLLDPRMGTAIAYCTGTRTVICCPAGQLASDGAPVLSALAEGPGFLSPRRTGRHRQTVTVEAVPRADLPGARGLGLALLDGAGARVQIYMWAGLLTPALARVIGRLCTAQSAYLETSAALPVTSTGSTDCSRPPGFRRAPGRGW